MSSADHSPGESKEEELFQLHCPFIDQSKLHGRAGLDYDPHGAAKPADVQRALKITRLDQPQYAKAKEWASKTGFTNIQSQTHRALDISENYDFRLRHMSIRDREAGGRHRPRILIVITVFNEDATELRFTLEGIAENIDNFAQLGIEKRDTKGCFGIKQPYRHVTWEDVAVIIVSDGVINNEKDESKNVPCKSFREYLAELGLWDEDKVAAALAEREKPGDPTSPHKSTALLFERVALLPVGSSPAFHEPMQLAYCGKVRNGGKLSSHQVFFDGFCRAVDPDYVFLLDVGTRPSPMSIVRLFAAMETNENIGGCCGDITVSMRNACDYVNPIFAAQVFEYKTANYIGKAMESFFGFISVLPGAFSAYRWKAIDGPPLSRYFAQLTPEADAWGPFERNIYLAEDRVLCAEIITRKRASYLLRYVKNAPAETDVPSNIAQLMAQRRRWSNGAFFASVYAIQNFARVWREANHSLGRRILLSIQFAFYSITLILGFLTVGIYYLSLSGLINSYFDSFGQTSFRVIGDALQFFFLSLCALQMLFAVRVKPKSIVTAHTLCAVFFSMFSILALGLGFRLVFFVDGVQPFVRWIAIGIFGSFEFAAILHQDPFSVLATVAQYLAFSGVYTIMIPIFSFSNTQDVSWGTRDSGGHAQTKQLQFDIFSVVFLTVWLMSNTLVVAAANLSYFDASTLIEYLFAGAAGLQGFQFTSAILYMILHWARKYRYCGGRIV